MSRRASRILMSCWLVVAAAGSALAQAEPKTGETPPLSPEVQAAMAAWERAMTPGPQHRKLAEASGSWSFRGQLWMDPGQPPVESVGTCERTMLFGGRIQQQRVTGQFLGQPFEGMLLAGYDNVTGRHWSVWTDNFSTSPQTSLGTCDAAGERCEFEDTYSDPMTGKEGRTRTVLVRDGVDREVMTTWAVGPDGKESKTMEFVYERRP